MLALFAVDDVYAVVSKNTNELKIGTPGCFGIDVYALGWAMGARILGHEDADPVLCQNSALLKETINPQLSVYV